MIQTDIDAVYNNMLSLLKEELVISQNSKDNSRISYRLRNIFTFMFDHYDKLVNANKELIETHMSKYYTYPVELINSEYNLLYISEINAIEKKTLEDYKKTIDCVKRFTDKYYNSRY
uniref:Uncharacterized protein n=1 Tax=viral metagenome TaxID=1070528 RepID=A0A6C0E496_9ZZZZ